MHEGLPPADRDVCDRFARNIMKMLSVHFRADLVDVCCASHQLPEPWDNEAWDKTTVKRDWRNLPQTAGRLVPSEPGSYTNCTRGGVLFLS